MNVYGPPKPCDIYDATTGIKKEADGSLSVRKLSTLEAIHGDEKNITMLALKRQRDQLLRNSDGQVAPDMLIWTENRMGNLSPTVERFFLQ